MIMTNSSLLRCVLALGVFVDSGMMRHTPAAAVPWMVEHTDSNTNAMDHSNDGVYNSLDIQIQQQYSMISQSYVDWNFFHTSAFNPTPNANLNVFFSFCRKLNINVCL